MDKTVKSTNVPFNITTETHSYNTTEILLYITTEFLSHNASIKTSDGRPGRMPVGPPTLNDDSYYVIPEAISVIIRKVCYLGITPILIIFGLVFNTICLVMFWRMTPKTSTTILLLTLTITDIVYAISAGFHVLFVASSFYEIPFTVDQRIQAVPYFYSYIRPLPGRFSAVLTLVISLERLLCVLKPIKIRQYWTKKTAVISVVTLVVLTVALSSPLALINQTRKIYISATKTYIRIVERTTFGRNDDVVDMIYLIDEIIFGYIPVIGVAVSSSITATVVVRSAKMRSKLTSSIRKRTNEMQITKMLLVVILVFFICKLPGQTLGLIIFIKMKPYKYTSNIYEVALALTYIPLLINAVVNIIIYYKTSATYRTRIKELMVCNYKQQSTDSSQYINRESTQKNKTKTDQTNVNEQISVISEKYRKESSNTDDTFLEVQQNTESN